MKNLCLLKIDCNVLEFPEYHVNYFNEHLIGNMHGYDIKYIENVSMVIDKRTRAYNVIHFNLNRQGIAFAKNLVCYADGMLHTLENCIVSVSNIDEYSALIRITGYPDIEKVSRITEYEVVEEEEPNYPVGN